MFGNPQGKGFSYSWGKCSSLLRQCMHDITAKHGNRGNPFILRRLPGCGGRSVHRYATAVSRKMVNCRNNLGKLFNANESNEIIFTKNATHSLNQVAKGLNWEKDDVILTTDREHNSNLVPWLQLEEEKGVTTGSLSLMKIIHSALRISKMHVRKLERT
ncbi:MAG: hypothetical protein CM15mP71_5410 [Candidatus Poseidoniales archaeon]|nr:MAG: hypothetical protein CM15mP71_5410 [Candidatus Poseidoniales archaeon]